MPGPGGEVTLLLAQLRERNQDADNQRVPLVYKDLRRVVGAYMQRERPDHPLQPTALVHETYLRLTGGESGQWQNRAHFFAIAAHTIRQTLVDYARKRSAGKRGGALARKVNLDAELPIAADTLENAVAIDEVLERLAQIDPRQGPPTELHFFGALSVEEAAEVIGVSAITIKREWRLAEAWLHRGPAAGKSG